LALLATVEAFETIEDAVVELGLSTPDGLRVLSLHSIDDGRPPLLLTPGTHVLRADIDVALIPGDYGLDLGLSRGVRGATLDLVEQAVRVKALPTNREGVDRYPAAQPRGFVRPRSDWTVTSTDAISHSSARQ